MNNVTEQCLIANINVNHQCRSGKILSSYQDFGTHFSSKLEVSFCVADTVALTSRKSGSFSLITINSNFVQSNAFCIPLGNITLSHVLPMKQL